MATGETSFIAVSKNDPSRLRVVTERLSADAGVDVAIKLLSIDQNTRTYALVGDRLHYWSVWPLRDNAEESRLPAWGIAEVTRSKEPGIAIGSLLYGVWPVATTASLQLEPVAPNRFRATESHRAAVFETYNTYSPVPPDVSVGFRCAWRPQFSTAAVLVSAIAHGVYPMPERIVVTSAFSKTGLAIAFLARKHLPDLAIIGCHSDRSAARSGPVEYFDETLSYDEMDRLQAGGPTMVVDLASSEQVLASLYEQIADRMSCCLAVGLTHRTDYPEARSWPGPVQPQPFFAPIAASAILARLGGQGAAVSRAERQREDNWVEFSAALERHHRPERVGRLEEAAARIEAMFAGRRTEPWIFSPVS